MSKTLDKKRCKWACSNLLEKKYHDQEWGVPSFDDAYLFELLILEGAQAGLSWSTVLAKREGYRKAFKGFDVLKCSKLTDTNLESLFLNPKVVRNKLKIKSVKTNAQAFLKVQKEFGSFSDYLWPFVDFKPVQNKWKNYKEVPASTDISERLSKDLKKRGFKFVGPTICYAYMQAVGLVNDHEVSCFRHKECSATLK